MIIRKMLLILAAIYIWNVPRAHAVAERGDYPWNVPGTVGSWQEQEMVDAGVNGWFIPMGPTGIRAQLTHENPNYFTVKYVFKNSPAGGKINPGDIIVGANGVELTKPHVFGRDSASWEGPLTDMAKLIEDSQGKDGSLELIVWPGGAKEKKTKVMIQIKPVGRFSPTYPYNCPRSDKQVTELCAYLADELAGKNGRAKMGQYAYWHLKLALMASGESKYDPILQADMTSLMGIEKGIDPKCQSKAAWSWGYQGIMLAEYYRKFKDKKLLPVMKKLSECLYEMQDPSTGATSHAPFPGIQNRLAAGGPNGYGQMSGPGGLAAAALGLFKAAGVEYPEEGLQRLHQTYLRCATDDQVRIGYGFPNRSFAIIALEDGSQAKSPKGCGFRVPTGMEGVTKFKPVYPNSWMGGGHKWIYNQEVQKASAMGKKDMFWWIEAERAQNEVYDITYQVTNRYGTLNNRLVCRSEVLPEPTKPYNTVKACGAKDHAVMSTGLGAIAHLTGGKGNKSWEYLGKHCANTCAASYGNWFDGHAAGAMHQLWIGLGASMADPDRYRTFMDGVKWWFVMMQTHDGSYFICPNRDRPSGCNTDPKNGPHVLPTANAALMLSVPRKQLMITGADPGTTPSKGYSSSTASAPSGYSASSSASSKQSAAASAPPARKGRTIDPEKRTALNAALQKAMLQLSTSGQLKAAPLRLSITPSTVSVSGVESNGIVELKSDKGVKAKIPWTKFAPADYSTFAQLIAVSKPDSGDSQALAGVYLEINGDLKRADEYYSKAGIESCDKFNKIFKNDEAAPVAKAQTPVVTAQLTVDNDDNEPGNDDKDADQQFN